MSPSSTPPPSSSPDPEVLASVPDSFASDAVEAYETLSEEPRSVTSRTIEFLSSATKKMWETFGDADLVGKGAMVATGAATAYIGIKVIEKGIDLFRSAWDKVTHLGDTFESALTGLHDMTKEKLLASVLGVGAVGGLLYGLIKLDWDEIWDEARKHDGSFVAGFFGATVDRIVSGVVEMPGEWWDDLAEKFDFLPSRAKLGELRDKGKEVVDQVRQGAADLKDDIKEGISESADWLSEFSEKSGLGKMWTRISGFLDADSRFAGWRSNASLAPLLDFENPSKIVEYLGLDTSEKRAEFYKTLPPAAAVGASSFLLFKLFDTPWAKTLTGINVALYMVLQNEHVDMMAVGLLDRLQEKLTDLQIEIEKVTRHFNIQPEWLNMKPGEFNLKTAMDFLFEMAKAHPDFTALAVLDSAILGRKVIGFVVWSCLGLLSKGAIESAKFAYDNKVLTAIVGSLALLTFTERRQVIIDLANLLYPGNEDGRREFILDMHRYLNHTGVFALEDQPTIVESAFKPLYDHLTEDREGFFDDNAQMDLLAKGFKDKKIIMGVLGVGSYFIEFIGGTNLAAHTVMIGKDIFDSIIDEFETRGLSSDNVGVYLTYAGELVLGSVALLGVKDGYVSLSSEVNGIGRGVRLGKSLVPFITAEWQHVHLKSPARTLADLIPGFRLSDYLHAEHVANLSVQTQKLARLFENLKGIGPNSPEWEKAVKDFVQVADHIDELCDQYKPVKGKEFLVKQDIEFRRFLIDVKSDVGPLRDAVKEGNFNDQLLSKLKSKILHMESRFSRKISRVYGLNELDPSTGKPLESLVRVVHGSEVTERTVQRIKNPDLKLHARELGRLGFSEQALFELDRSPIDKAEVLDLIRSGKERSDIVKFLNRIAYDERYRTQLRIIRNFKVYEGMGLLAVIGVLYGLDHAENKGDYLIENVASFSGFGAGVAAVRGAEHFTRTMPPVARLFADFVVGTAGALGAGAAVKAWVLDPLDKAYPNRHARMGNVKVWGGEEVFYAVSTLLGAGPVFDWFKMSLNGVDEDVNPLDYLTETVKAVTLRRAGSLIQDVTMNWEEDLAENSQKRIDRYEDKIESIQEDMRSMDSSSEKYMHLESEIRRLGLAIQKLRKNVDGTWAQDARRELFVQRSKMEELATIFANLATEHEWPNDRFKDRGSTMVHTLVSRMLKNNGQDFVDEDDMEIWAFLSDHEPVEFEGAKLTFQDFLALVALVGRRENQFKQLGMEPYSLEGFLHPPPNPPTT